MKYSLRTIISLTLTAAAMSNISLTALSYTGLGGVVSVKRDYIGDGLIYSSLSSIEESGKTQRSYIFEYDPTSNGTLPIVRYGDHVYGMDRLGSLVSTEANNGKTVLGAVNGDFYSMQTGVPMGVMIDGGRIISSDDGKFAVGFTDNGVLIGRPEVKISLSREGDSFEIDQLNKYPTIWGVYMVTSDYARTTTTSYEALEITLHLEGDIMTKGNTEGIVTAISEGMSAAIPEGHAVITVAKSHEDYAALKALAVGEKVHINTSCAEGWDSVSTAIGGGDLILDNGVMPEGIIDEDHEKVSNPRTAVGVKDDGTVVFFAVEGRSDTARGLKLEELAAVMSELGCVRAVNLDGGGSTTVMVKPADKSECAYITAPIGSSYRSLANAILFVSANPSDGVPAVLSLSPSTPYLLRGSSTGFTAISLDSAYMPTEKYIDPNELALAFAETYGDSAGTVSGGVYTAGMTGGEYRLTASAQGITGKVSVIVVDTLDTLEVSATRTRARPGDTVELSVEATYNGNPVICDSASFYYTIDGTHTLPDAEKYPDAMIVCDYGYVDKNGNFKVFDGDIEAEVEVGVWFDQFVRYVKIKIGSAPELVADFETVDQLADFTFEANDGAYAMPVGNGYKSDGGLELNFAYEDLAGGAAAKLDLQEPLMISGAESIRMWAHGDISGILRAIVTDENGTEYSLSYTVTKDYSKQIGWREITAQVPAELADSALYLKTLIALNDSGTAERHITIDSPRIYYGKELPPDISGLENHWAASYIYDLYDRGVIEDSDCEAVDGERYYNADAALTRGEFAKLLTLWYGIDAMAYANADIKLEASTPLDKLPYIRAAIAEGLMSGRGIDSDGLVIFDANATITRQEAFKVIGSRIAVSETELSFTDSADVASWAMSGVAKCVASGVVSGYPDKTIRPYNSITRCELAAMLGKLK